MENIPIKTDYDIKKMREAGHLAADVLDMITQYVKPGVTTEELDKICHNYMLNVQRTIPAPLNYKGFPKSICTSVNHVVCHGVPGPKKLKEGDILNIDITIIKDGYHADVSRMYAIDKISLLAERLVKIAHECLYIGIAAVKPGVHIGDIGYVIQKHAEAHRFSVVRDYCGHGIGRNFHEPPQVPHFGTPNSGIVLKPGMIFTIEPMINAGKKETKTLPDGWTAVTKDHSLSAQWEHTILVTETGHEILTQI